MLSGQGEGVLVSVMHEGSGMAAHCSAIDDWLSVCADVALAKAYMALLVRIRVN